MVLDVSDKFCPEQIGVLLPGTGAAGMGFTVTEVVAAGPAQPATVTLTEYVPEAAVVAGVIAGSSSVEVKLLGPVQL